MKKNNFHIVYILTKLELGGAQKVCLSLMDDFIKKGISVSLITGPEGPLTSHAKKFDSVFFLDSFKREISIKNLWLEVRNFFTISKILRHLKKKHGNIIVHTHSTKAGLIGRWAAFFTGIKNRVHTVHGYGFHEYQSWLTWLPIYFLELITSIITTHFVCVSNKDRQTGIRLFPLFEKKSSIIRAAVEWEKFIINMPATKDNKTFIVGTIACFKPQKNVFDLLKAFKFAHDKIGKKIELQIIGDGLLRPQIKEWIKENNLATSITLLGWQSNVAPFLKSWDLFALSSLWEGLPCSIIEALLSGVPVVSYNIGGVSEVVDDGRNGFLIKPGDWQQLGKKIISLSMNPKKHRKMAEHKQNLNEFHHASMSEKHYSLYKNLTKNTQ